MLTFIYYFLGWYLIALHTFLVIGLPNRIGTVPDKVTYGTWVWYVFYWFLPTVLFVVWSLFS